MITHDWLYKGRPFKTEDAGDNAGFTYRITCSANGKAYIGKKVFEFSDNKRLWTKKGLKEMAEKGIKKSDLKTVADKKPYTRRSIGRRESNWKDYWGSASADDCALNKDIEKFGKGAFTREILELVKTRGELSYAEVRQIVLHDAVRRPDFYNNNLKINCRGAQIITSADTRVRLHNLARKENPSFAKTHGPQAPKGIVTMHDLEKHYGLYDQPDMEPDNYPYECDHI